jgi:hypothetical protein
MAAAPSDLPKMDGAEEPTVWRDKLCTGEIDVSPFKSETPDLRPCMNDEFILQGDDEGHYRVVCAKCGKTVELC